MNEPFLSVMSIGIHYLTNLCLHCSYINYVLKIKNYNTLYDHNWHCYNIIKHLLFANTKMNN